MRAPLAAILASACLAPLASAHLHFVTWEEFPSGSPISDGTVISNQFNLWGAMYTQDQFVVRDDGQPDFITGPHTAFLSHGADNTQPATLRMDFVVHGTSIASICDFIAITPIDSASPGTIFTMTAWDSEDGVIFATSTEVEPTGIYDPNEDVELVIFSPNIAYVTFSATAPNGGVVEVELDNLRYNHILPAPGVAALLMLCAGAVVRRRRASCARTA
jgi:uncharacterized protein (TIGR03382 family)